MKKSSRKKARVGRKKMHERHAIHGGSDGFSHGHLEKRKEGRKSKRKASRTKRRSASRGAKRRSRSR